MDISILFITYNRSDLLQLAVNSIRPAILELGMQVEFVVADDSSDLEHLEVINQLNFDLRLISPINRGLGANQNLGLNKCKGKYILHIQDDWIFTGKSADIINAIKILQSNPAIGILQLTTVLSDLPTESRNLDACEFVVFKNDGLPWFRSCGVRPYSDRPHLKRREFFDDIGPYLEGVPIGPCENDYKKRVANQNKWLVGQLVVPSLFQNMGEQVSLNPIGRTNFLAKFMQKMPFIGTILLSQVRKIYRLIDHLAAVIWSTIKN